MIESVNGVGVCTRASIFERVAFRDFAQETGLVEGVKLV